MERARGRLLEGGTDQTSPNAGGELEENYDSMWNREGELQVVIASKSLSVRVWDPARLPGVYSSVKSLQRRRLESRNRDNTEQLCSGLL
jgi:hypothetical protein